MNKTDNSNQTTEITIHFPQMLAEKVDSYAKKTGTDIENVMIKALDVFLTEKRKNRDEVKKRSNYP